VVAQSDSNSRRTKPDCRMMDISVPVRSSPWSGTGTVIVDWRPTALHDDMAAATADLDESIVRQNTAGVASR